MRNRSYLVALAFALLVSGIALSSASASPLLLLDPTPPPTPLPTFSAPGEEAVSGSTHIFTAADGTQYRVYDQINRILGTGPTPTPVPTVTPAPTPTPMPPVIAYDDRAFSYFGTWGEYIAPTPNATKYGVGDHFSATTGSAYGFLFTGTQMKLVGSRSPWLAIASVSLDGATPVDVDLYRSTNLDQTIQWDSGPIAQGVHRIIVKVTGRKNALASEYQINTDRADITDGALIAPLAP